jgi:PAS domain S-box-containing protein
VTGVQTCALPIFLPDGTFLFVNEVYCRLFGKPAEELIGKQWHPVVHPDDLPLVEARLREMSMGNPVVDIENRVYAADGELRWMHFVNRGVFTTDGQLKEIQSVGRDITPLKTYELRLASKQARLELGLAMANLVAWEIDLITGISKPDPSVEQLLGYTLAEMTRPWAWRPLLDPRDASRVERELMTHLNGDSEQFHSEYRLRHKNGHWVLVENRSRVVERDPLGKPLRMVGVLRDITQRKRLHVEGVELLQRIEALIREGVASSPDLSANNDIIETLSKREKQVLIMIADGMTSAQIGKQLHLSANTINVHRQKLMAKLDLHSTAEVTRFTIAHGLIRKP